MGGKMSCYTIPNMGQRGLIKYRHIFYDDGAVHSAMILASYVRVEQHKTYTRSSYLPPIRFSFLSRIMIYRPPSHAREAKPKS